MHTAARKLHSQRGASMLFALLVFFLCLLAGVAALTAAAANVGRYTRLEGEQQQYYSVASAMELLQARLDEHPVTITVQCVETYQWWYEDPGTPGAPLTFNSHLSTEYRWSDPAAASNLTYFQYQLFEHCLPDEWQTALRDLSPSLTTPADVAKEYTVALDPTSLGATAPDWADTLFPVHVAVKNASAPDASPYALEMVLTTQEDGGAYPLKAVWSGEAETSTNTAVETETRTGLTSPTIGGTPVGDVGVRKTTTTLTCTLRWSADNRTAAFLHD